MKMLMLATTAAMIEQFNKNNILLLEEMGYEVHVAGNFLQGNPISEERLDAFKHWLDEHHGKWFNLPSTRKPWDFKGNGRALKIVTELINDNQYDFIHCHTPLGSVIGRIAAHRTGTKIIYTAHGFHFYNGAPLKNWLMYYPVERFLSRWTDVLITINEEDYKRAIEKFHAGKTVYIPGIGVDTKKYAPENTAIIRENKRKEIGVPENARLLISVGELIERKNHKAVVRALQNLPDDYWYVIVGKGELRDELMELDKTGHLILLGFRTDIRELLWSSDLFVFPSVQEGLSVALMEAMSAGLPCIVSKIRGNTDLIKDEDLLFEPNDVQRIGRLIESTLAGNGINNENRVSEIKESNLTEIRDYDCELIQSLMKEIYKNI